MNPTIGVIMGALSSGVVIGGAGTINRRIARGVSRITGSEPGGLTEQAAEFFVPVSAVAVSLASNPTSVVGATVARTALTGATMALVESTAGTVRSLLGPSQAVGEGE